MGSWSPGYLSSGNFSTAVNTRSLSVASTGVHNDSEDLVTSEQAILYYESPTGKVLALCLEVYQFSEESIYNNPWVDITSQESMSLPDQFHNTPAITAARDSKTLYESLATNSSTLSAPFTCQGTNRSQQFDVGAIFYSPNASNFGFQSSNYSTGPIGAGNFSRSLHFVFPYPVLMFIS